MVVTRGIGIMYLPLLIIGSGALHLFSGYKKIGFAFLVVLSFSVISSELLVYNGDISYKSSVSWIYSHSDIMLSERIVEGQSAKYDKFGYFGSLDFPARLGHPGFIELVFQENSLTYPISIKIFDVGFWGLAAIKKSSVEGSVGRIHKEYMDTSYSNVVYSNGFRRWNMQNEPLLGENNQTYLPENFIIQIENFEYVGWSEERDPTWLVSYLTTDSPGSKIYGDVSTLEGLYDLYITAANRESSALVSVCGNETILNAPGNKIKDSNTWSTVYIGRFYVGESCQIMIEHINNGPEEYADHGSALDNLDFRWYGWKNQS
jgi:hypothetical protein